MGGGVDLVPGSCSDLLLLDVTPLSLGIELEGKQMSTLIKRNTAIPCRKTRTYTTVADFQTDIDVVIYEGERPVRLTRLPARDRSACSRPPPSPLRFSTRHAPKAGARRHMGTTRRGPKVKLETAEAPAPAFS